MYTTRIPVRPGWIVVLRTAVEDKTFGATVKAHTVLRDEITNDGHSVKETKNFTERTDPDEFQAATDLRLKLRSRATSYCTKTPWGLICDDDDLAAMEASVEEVVGAIDAFNLASTCYTIVQSWRLGECSGDKVREARAVCTEVTRLVDHLQAALAATGDMSNRPRTIRDICTPMIAMANLLEPESDAGAALNELIKSARSTASAIVKVGEEDAQAIQELLAQAEQSSLVSARTIFAAPVPATTAEPPPPSMISPGRVAAVVQSLPLPPGLGPPSSRAKGVTAS